MKLWSKLWLVLLAASLVGAGYWLGLSIGQQDSSSQPTGELQARGQGAVAAADPLPLPANRRCQQAGASPLVLFECFLNSAATADIATRHAYLGRYLDAVLDAGEQPTLLMDTLSSGIKLPADYLFHYIEAEVDPRKIALASQALKLLLRQRPAASLSATEVDWLIARLDRLLWLLPEDISLHLWLAELHLQRGQVEDVRYHALIAANIPAYREAATKILQKTKLQHNPAADIELEIVGNQYFVSVRINGIGARLLLDTGASISGLTQVFVESQGLDTSAAQEVMLNTAAGVKAAHQFRVEQLVLGAVVLTSHPMVIFPDAVFKGFDGVLGLDVLRQVDYYIDDKAAKLRIF